MKIEIRSNLQPFPLEEAELALLVKVLQTAAKGEGHHHLREVSLFLTDDVTMQVYNKKFRHIDQATDVLSFPLCPTKEEEELFTLREGQYLPLGDILISLERCSLQAQSYGHSETRELCFLALHGLLHLFGYDHVEAAEAEKMAATAAKYLTALGVQR